MRGLGTIECFMLTAHSRSCSEQETLGLPGLLSSPSLKNKKNLKKSSIYFVKKVFLLFQEIRK